MKISLLLPAIICSLCWGGIISLVLIRQFHWAGMRWLSNSSVLVLQLINLGYCLPTLVIYLNKAVDWWEKVILKVALTTDLLATLGLIIFAAVSMMQLAIRLPAKIDYLVVLGAATNNGQPSLILQTRLLRAIQVWQTNRQAQIIVTGTKVHGEALTEATVMKKFLIDHDVPADLIIEEPQAANTWQNLAYVNQLLKRAPHIVVVTSEFHIIRVKSYLAWQGLPWSTCAAKTPSRYYPLTMTRDYLGILRDNWRKALLFLLGSIVIVGGIF